MRVVVVFGTRPEIIKLAPVALQLKASRGADIHLCSTGQHRQMLDMALDVFKLQPDIDLGIMQPNQSLSGIAAAVLAKLDDVFTRLNPDWVLVQGDTTTTMAASLAAFHRNIKVGHVEAGLRTGNLANPWPEEANRRITSVVASRHYCPTERARTALLKEGVPGDRILVTGNTVIDALLLITKQIAADSERQAAIARRFDWLDKTKKLILVTGHRRESFGQGFDEICRALSILGQRPDVQVVYPVHLNPNVQQPVFAILGDKPAIKLIEPLDYETFVWLMQQCHFVLTDSGGVQEEAPSLGKPVLIMRDTTERPEGIDAGVSKLVGTVSERIVAECEALLTQPETYMRMSRAVNPFGDGTAAHKIVGDLLNA